MNVATSPSSSARMAIESSLAAHLRILATDAKFSPSEMLRSARYSVKPEARSCSDTSDTCELSIACGDRGRAGQGVWGKSARVVERGVCELEGCTRR